MELLAVLQGVKLPKVEKAADGWTTETGPANEEAWNAEVKYFLDSLQQMNTAVAEPDKYPGHKYFLSVYDVAQCMASHVSYHLGEIILLRRILGIYPPPGGGLTW